jgi:eukaryotic-like serine/threonine-protein kinase
MSLTAGTKFGPYEIVSPLGAGGMGEVYRARDSRLGRDVAIKILPPQISGDPAGKLRFEREARTISKLNHPHICVLHDIGSQDGVDYIVMECVEGETLAKRLERGPLPLDQVLKFGAQIADALDKAHRSGVVHRDLKPGNVMLTPTGAKLLDFGLAKPAVTQGIGMTLTAEALQSTPVTQAGTIVGTFQYMSPEQIEGKEVDGRSDIFALGAVLYEMLTGKRAFEGKSQLSVASAILEKEPEPINTTKPLTPPALDHAIRLCLAKSPEDRWQTARDLALDLNWIAEGGSQTGVAVPGVVHRRARQKFAWALLGAGAALLLAAALAYVVARPYLNQPNPNVARFLLSLPPEVVAWSSIRTSPDGRLLAFVGISKDGRRQLWLRPLNSVAAQPLPGTDAATAPFWSPDSQYLGFFDGSSLKKVAISGGSPQTLCDAPRSSNATWNSDGVIVFDPGNGAFWKIPQAGGAPSPLTTLDQSLGEVSQGYPTFLPDGRHFLYISFRHTTAILDLWLCVGSLDSKETKCLQKTESPAVYAPPGDLLYLRGTTLMAQPFDAEKLMITGDAVPIAEGVQPYSYASAVTSVRSFSASENGTLAYVGGGASDQFELQWFDRSGKKLETLGQPADYTSPSLSPDGNRVAVGIMDPHVGARDLWIFDMKRGTASRLTFDPADELSPLWSRDGSQILFSSEQSGSRDIYEKSASGLGDSEIVFQSKDQRKSVNDWSADGRYVVYDLSAPPTALWVLPLFGDRKPFPFVQEAYDARQAHFSPNGRYIAYTSSETGNYEIYVQTFPEHTGKWQVSAAGGTYPVWRRDGKELYFVSGNKLMAVDVKTDGPPFTAGIPKPLFEANFRPGNWSSIYTVTADGQRFLAITDIVEQSIPPITVVTNWAAELKP